MVAIEGGGNSEMHRIDYNGQVVRQKIPSLHGNPVTLNDISTKFAAAIKQTPHGPLPDCLDNLRRTANSFSYNSPGNLSLEDTAMRRAINEAHMQYTIGHIANSLGLGDHVPQVMGVETSNNTFSILMEEINGQDLAEIHLLDQSEMNLAKFHSLQEQFRIIERILGASYDAGEYIHRDLKPSNLMQTPDGKLVLLDFGLGAASPNIYHTQNVSFGTPDFMAPEQITGEEKDYRTDRFSLAATFVATIAKLSDVDYRRLLNRFNPDTYKDGTKSEAEKIRAIYLLADQNRKDGMPTELKTDDFANLLTNSWSIDPKKSKSIADKLAKAMSYEPANRQGKNESVYSNSDGFWGRFFGGKT